MEISELLERCKEASLPIINIEYVIKPQNQSNKFLTFYRFNQRTISVEWRVKPGLSELTKLSATMNNGPQQEEIYYEKLKTLNDSSIREINLRALAKFAVADKTILKNIEGF